MQAEPVIRNKKVLIALLASTLALSNQAVRAQDEVKPPPPIPVVIFDNPASYGDNVPKGVADARDALRHNKRFEVMLFNPDSPTFTLAAKSAGLSLSPADLHAPEQFNALAVAVGAEYYVVLTQAERNKKVSADLVDVQSGAVQQLDKPESPDAVGADIATDLLNWSDSKPSSGATLTAPPANVPPVQAAPVAITPPLAASPAQASTAPTMISPAPAPVPTAQPVAPVQPRPSVTQPVSPPAAPEPALVPSSPILSGSNPAAVVPPTLDINGQIGRQTAAPQSNPPVPRRALTPSVPSAGANQAPPPAAAQSPVAVATVAPQPTAPAPTYYDNSTSGNAAAALMPTTTVTVLPAKPLDSAAANNELSPSFTSPSIVINGVSGGGVPVSGRGNASPNALGEQVSSVAQATIDQGDTALKVSDYLTAIQLYRKAVDMSPRAVTPRLRLANAYLDDGMKDQAVGVAQRALAIDPGNTDIQKFIQAQDTGANGPDGDVIIAQAQTRNDPTNPAGWISLGDAYWNTGDPDDSLISYKRAEEIDPNSIIPQTRLAKLYAARAQYDQSLAALQKSGTDGYPYALRIISSRSESLVGDIDDETQDLIKGVDTREQFYDRIKTTSSQAAGLSDFVSKIKPPDQYKISHLHRELATSLLAQTAAVWVDYAETNNDSDKDEAADLEKHAISEMKIASVAEDLQSRIKP